MTSGAARLTAARNTSAAGRFEHGGVGRQRPHPTSLPVSAAIALPSRSQSVPPPAQRVAQVRFRAGAAGAGAGGGIGVDRDAGRVRAPGRHRLQHHRQELTETWLQVRILQVETNDAAHVFPHAPWDPARLPMFM